MKYPRKDFNKENNYHMVDTCITCKHVKNIEGIYFCRLIEDQDNRVGIFRKCNKFEKEE